MKEKINIQKKDSSHKNDLTDQKKNSKKGLYIVLTIVGIILMAAGIVALIFLCSHHHPAEFEAGVTGAAQSAEAAVGAGAATAGVEESGVNIGGFSISTAALAIVVGGILALTGILKGRKIEFKSDGSLTVE